jgi:hypothetical protein
VASLVLLASVASPGVPFAVVPSGFGKITLRVLALTLYLHSHLPRLPVRCYARSTTSLFALALEVNCWAAFTRWAAALVLYHFGEIWPLPNLALEVLEFPLSVEMVVAFVASSVVAHPVVHRRFLSITPGVFALVCAEPVGLLPVHRKVRPLDDLVLRNPTTTLYIDVGAAYMALSPVALARALDICPSTCPAAPQSGVCGFVMASGTFRRGWAPPMPVWCISW